MERRPELRTEQHQRRSLPVRDDEAQDQQNEKQIAAARHADALRQQAGFDPLECHADPDAERDDQVEFGVAADPVAEPLQEAGEQGDADMQKS
jgi:hypothetical protein